MDARAIFGPPVEEPVDGGFVLSLDVITMVGHEFVLFRPEASLGEDAAEWWFPWDFFHVNESPAEAVRRVVREWTGTENPKLELVDFRHEVPEEGASGRLSMVFRAMLVEDPEPGEGIAELKLVPRGTLSGSVGWMEGKWVEEALKSSLPYKLTRR